MAIYLFLKLNMKKFLFGHFSESNSVFISEVKTEVKEVGFWKNLGTILCLALSYFDDFEVIYNINYNWIYYFDPKVPYSNMILYNINDIEKHILIVIGGIIKKVPDIQNIIPIIELLLRDDVCFTALSHLISSFENHYCCLICELGRSSVIMHESHEPYIWERAYYIPKMETGIIQACKCVESILGEPPNRNKQSRLVEHKNKWKDLLDIDADDIYKKAVFRFLLLFI